MCRWLAYSGAPLFLEDLIFKPEHSIIDQSLSAVASETTTNGDGFGVGWYGRRDFPGVYKNIRPAWNDANLRDLCAQIESRLFLAHIRAATATAIQHSNCHPFRFDRWIFVHNGLIEGFRQIRRTLMLGVDPELFPEIQGTTDSEIMFYLALTFGLRDDIVGGVERMVGFVEKIGHEHGIEHPVQMSLGISDGETLYGFRYSSEGRSRTLFHSKSMKALQEINPDLERFSPDARVIVSEPLGPIGQYELRDYWEEIPESTVVTVRGGEADWQPFEP